MFSPWFISLHNRVSKLSSSDQVVLVVVKMTEFTKNIKRGWVSKPFYDTRNKQCKLQLKIVVSVFNEVPYVSVLLLGEHEVHNKHMRQKQLDDSWITKLSRWCLDLEACNEPVVKLLNQISNDEHTTGFLKRKAMQSTAYPASPHMPPIDSNALYYNQQFISYRDLHRITATSHYLKDDTLFFEVLKV